MQYLYKYLLINLQTMKRIRKKATTETRLKQSIAKRGTNNPMYGRRHSEFTKQKISRAMKKYWENLYLEW